MKGFIKGIPGLKSGISRRLILYILLVSMVITFIGTGLKLYLDFNYEVNSIHTTFKQIESSYKNSIINSLWVTDDELLSIQMEGILQLPDIQFIKIRKEAEVLQAAGTPQSESVIEHIIPLFYAYNGRDVHLGDIHIIASLKGVYKRIFDRILIILGMQTINIFLVSLFIFIFFYQLVGRHIISMASFAESTRFDSMDQMFQLDRKLKIKKPDELAQLVISFNLMRKNLAHDINRREIAEQEIIKTKQFYENITEGVQDGIWVTDVNDVIFYANSAMEKIAGVPREQIQGNNILNDFSEEVSGNLIKYYKQAKEEKKPVWYDIKVKTPANRDTWQNGWLIPQFQENAFTGIICTIRDVTERKQAEELVRKLSTAVEQSPSIIVITDLEGNLEYVNPKFIELTGYSSSEVIGLDINILKSGMQDEGLFKEMWETVNSGEVWRGQFHNKKKNGEQFWEAVSISAIQNESGDVINFIQIGEDITQQKKTETELKVALEKALESDRLKSAFLANMSHELRTPMNGILGFVKLLTKPDLGKDKIDKYSGIISKSSDRLLKTINDIIDISKIEAGEMPVSTAETSINSVMDELLSFHSSEANLKGLSLVLVPSPSGEQIDIITDSHKLYVILSNLTKNAIKFTEKGSVTLGYTLKDSFIEFIVKDSGIGIPQDRIEAIFNRFEQADIEDKRGYEGSGLGLAISKAYAEMLDGEIFVESVEGEGSKFTLTIPYIKIEKKENAGISEKINSFSEKTRKMNLLIVEDDEVSVELLETMLHDIFQKTHVARNGMEAVRLCREDPEIDLVLMDIKMRVLNGYEATKQIREFNKDVIIIAQTAYALSRDRELSIEAGCDDHISKPIDLNELLGKIENCLSKN